MRKSKDTCTIAALEALREISLFKIDLKCVGGTSCYIANVFHCTEIPPKFLSPFFLSSIFIAFTDKFVEGVCSLYPIISYPQAFWWGYILHRITTHGRVKNGDNDGTLVKARVK